MSDAEVDEFLDAPHVMNIATIGPTGHPHLVAMWYAVMDRSPVFWTFPKTQKIRNLRRDPKISGLVEAGVAYAELQGVEVTGSAELIEDFDRKLEIGTLVAARYGGPDALSDAGRAAVEAQAHKRIAVRIDVDRWVTWDHRKLAGRY